MKDRFKGKKTTNAAEYKGKTYYLCCAQCPELFSANPEKYIKNKDKTQEEDKGTEHQYKHPHH